MSNLYLAYVSRYEEYAGLIKEVLETNTLKVDCFDSPEKAFSSLKTSPQKYFAVISGFYFETYDGLRLMAKLKENGSFGIKYRAIYSTMTGLDLFSHSKKINGITDDDISLIEKPLNSMKPLLNYVEKITSKALQS